jgi:predicted RNA binding protein YcfA (HicA-like mRNA interferase family)
MMNKNIQFAELTKFLTKLGFESVKTAGSHQVFKHTLSDALIVLPGYHQHADVDIVHLIAVRRILMENDLIDRNSFDSFVEKVPS